MDLTYQANEYWSERALMCKLVIAGVTTQQFLKLSQIYPSFEEGAKDQWQKVEPKLKNKLQIVPSLILDDNVDFITCCDDAYPKQLLKIKSFPLILWYQGDISLLKKECISIVGSRKMTYITKRILSLIIPSLVNSDIVVVSGIATGVDSASHEITLMSHGKTIAVLGGGIDEQSFSPTSSFGIRQQIIQSNNLIISQFPPNTKPTKYTFPIRNQIIAVLSNVTIVAQASKKSGSLLTVDYAKKLGNIVFSPVVDFFEPSVEGNREAIKAGAMVFTTADEILAIYNQKNLQTAQTPKNQKTMSLQEVIEYFELPLGELFSTLTQLELEGKLSLLSEDKYIVYD
jgi:DNA processing protein